MIELIRGLLTYEMKRKLKKNRDQAQEKHNFESGE